MAVGRASLGALTEIGRGNNATVHAVADRADVYKEFHHAVLGTEVTRWAEESVAFWQSLTSVERRELASFSVWPTDTVMDAGEVVGVLMPRIAMDFFHLRTDWTGRLERRTNDLSWLLVDERRLQGRFDPATIEDAVRLTLVGRMLKSISWLHDRGVVYGDVSATNFVFALNPPRVVVLDCDAVAVTAASASAASRNSPFMIPPELAHGHQADVDPQTDVWKCAMLALRCLTPGRGATQRKPSAVSLLPAHMPSRLVTVLTEALSSDRSRRPSVAQLADEVAAAVRVLCSPPVIDHVVVVNQVAQVGERVRVDWRVTGAERLLLRSPGAVETVLDVLRDAAGGELVADTSGMVTLIATNRHGQTMCDAGPVEIYRVPQVGVEVDLPELPDLRMPWPLRLTEGSVAVDAAGLRRALGKDRARLERELRALQVL